MKQNTVSDRLVAELRANIRSGKLKPGARVPSARELVREHRIALATAAKVLERLKRERLVRVVPGVGTVVRGDERGPELSLARIVEAGIAIADDEGLAGLSMRAVATEVGVPTMSIYRHVPSRDDLILAMVDEVLAEQKPPVVRGNWRTKLEAIARQHWEGYERHPWLAAALSISRPQLVPNGMVHTEYILEVLEELPLSPARRLQTCLAFIGLIRGMAVNIEPEREAQRDTGLSSTEWMESREAEFIRLVKSGDRFPRLSAMALAPDIDVALPTLFERGLACFLDGLGVA